MHTKLKVSAWHCKCVVEPSIGVAVPVAPATTWALAARRQSKTNTEFIPALKLTCRNRTRIFCLTQGDSHAVFSRCSAP